ncbi:hypothetical protein BH10ACI2_BH10ACI2_00380 [soil metagenome]
MVTPKNEKTNGSKQAGGIRMSRTDAKQLLIFAIVVTILSVVGYAAGAATGGL